MLEYLLFWLAKSLAEIGLLVFVAAAVFALYLLVHVCEKLRQRGCKHDGAIHETQACDAICTKCGKNLGFIGAWRNRK